MSYINKYKVLTENQIQISNSHMYLRFILFLFLIFLIGCGSKKTDKKQTTAYEIKSICPVDGSCSFTSWKNKSLLITYYEGNKPSPEIVNGPNIVIQFEYKRHEVPNASDGHYSEHIYIEFAENETDLELEGKNLQNVKLLFGRFCYCKGQNGFYKITNGKLSIKKLKVDNLYELKLQFTTNEVPQIITEIKETFRL